jgi:hypothetical protein
VTYACGLLAAPFQQRDALRAKLYIAETTIAALEAIPVSQAHGNRLRQIAEKLSECVKRPDVALDYGEDPGTWSEAFREHFPALGLMLDQIEEAGTAYAAFRSRLGREAQLAGMGERPWLLNQFADSLAGAIRRRAMQDLLEAPFNFDWHESVGYAVVGDPPKPDRPWVIFNIVDAADPIQVKRTFEVSDSVIAMSVHWSRPRVRGGMRPAAGARMSCGDAETPVSGLWREIIWCGRMS